MRGHTLVYERRITQLRESNPVGARERVDVPLISSMFFALSTQSQLQVFKTQSVWQALNSTIRFFLAILGFGV